MQTILGGITASQISTPRLTAQVLERSAIVGSSDSSSAPGDARTVVLVHGNVSSSLFFQPLMLALPSSIRAVAVDLRGFGGSQTLPIDATRGVRDFSDDVASVLDALGIGGAHVVGWSLGGGVVMQLLLDRPDLVASLTLESPVSPYGFGSTGADGAILNGGAGAGGGGANPDFVARLDSDDRSDDSPTSPRSVYRSAYVKRPEAIDHEDLWVESMLTTATGIDNYPGNSAATDAWPGFAPGTTGVLNTLAPGNFDTTAIVGIPAKPPILWIRGADDAIVSDTSFFDLNYLGQLGAIPGWPGADVAPAQPMVSQTRAVLDAYSADGGAYREVVFEDCGHSPHLEQPEGFVAALVEHIG
ncbi:alpha/beta fold hydrolase [Naasia lichenicola]|uniref:Alpha/beta hydrolase n=1 Tax=Naasia lichenicola TaxID=2565933 RepID=A0A4S4FHY7_9MICO|nr:alpha/beta hydrolase [Naasia lichenicola]THG29859.1 alpha/beta hydrolase [Naasia lichenicola]